MALTNEPVLSFKPDRMNLAVARKQFYEVVKAAQDDLVAFSANDTSLRQPANRRGYYRAFFAFLETVMFATRRLILNGHAVGMFQLSFEQQLLLREKHYDLTDSGKIRETPRFLPFKSNFRYTFDLFFQTYKPELKINYGEDGWQALLDALKVRDRIMHPKNSSDFIVSDDEVKLLKRARAWFFRVQHWLNGVLVGPESPFGNRTKDTQK